MSVVVFFEYHDVMSRAGACVLQHLYVLFDSHTGYMKQITNKEKNITVNVSQMFMYYKAFAGTVSSCVHRSVPFSKLLGIHKFRVGTFDFRLKYLFSIAVHTQPLFLNV